jgi:hypothetical protein
LRFETGWGENTNSAVKSGTMKLYLFGFIKYHDEMNDMFLVLNKKETGFCFFMCRRAGLKKRSSKRVESFRILIQDS